MDKFDRGIFFTFIGLTIFGLIMMSSISVAESYATIGRNDYYFWRHFVYILAGIPLFWVATHVPLSWVKKLATPFFIASVLLLMLVLIVGDDYGTAARSWIRVGSFSLQPVEISKLALVIMLSAIFARKQHQIATFAHGFMPFAIIAGIPVLLIMLQPDFGSLFVLTLTAAMIYFIAGANTKHFLGGLAVGSVGAVLVTVLTPYISKRVQVFLQPDLDPLGIGFQVKQALIAIGSGGIWGKGFQNSIQKFDYLPEVQSDTIFAAIAEEMGFVRILLLLSAYMFITWRGVRIAQRTTDCFQRLLAIGLTTWISGQAMVNIAVNLALLPNTGITLPLISYGGTSIWAMFAAIGLLLNISTHTNQPSRKRRLSIYGR